MKQAGRYRSTADSPARQSYAVTPHATDEIGDFIPKGIYVGGAGNINGRLVGDTEDQLFTGIAAGTYLPFAFQFIRVEDTTATNIIALY